MTPNTSNTTSIEIGLKFKLNCGLIFFTTIIIHTCYIGCNFRVSGETGHDISRFATVRYVEVSSLDGLIYSFFWEGIE